MSEINSLITTIIQLTFVVLKLTEVVDWSWWIIMLPTLIPVMIVIILLIVLGFCWVVKKCK